MKWLKTQMKERLDEAVLVNKAMEIVDWDMKELEEMSKRDKEEILKSAHEIIKQPAFKYVLSGLIMEQIKHTVREGTKESQYIAGRSVIAGVDLVRDTMERLSVAFENLNEEDNFDKESII